jgi:hypothetical protein
MISAKAIAPYTFAREPIAGKCSRIVSCDSSRRNALTTLSSDTREAVT